VNTIFWKWIDFDANWHNWSTWQGHLTINFRGQEVKGYGQGHTRLKLDLEAWCKHILGRVTDLVKPCDFTIFIVFNAMKLNWFRLYCFLWSPLTFTVLQLLVVFILNSEITCYTQLPVTCLVGYQTKQLWKRQK